VDKEPQDQHPKDKLYHYHSPAMIIATSMMASGLNMIARLMYACSIVCAPCCDVCIITGFGNPVNRRVNPSSSCRRTVRSSRSPRCTERSPLLLGLQCGGLSLHQRRPCVDV